MAAPAPAKLGPAEAGSEGTAIQGFLCAEFSGVLPGRKTMLTTLLILFMTGSSLYCAALIGKAIGKAARGGLQRLKRK